jgi:hypothetical protein
MGLLKVLADLLAFRSYTKIKSLNIPVTEPDFILQADVS